VPVRGVLYALAAIAAALLCGRLPLLATVTSVLPWYLLDVALPVASAEVLSAIRIDGRPFHLAAQALLHHRLQSRRSVGLRRQEAGWGLLVGVAAAGPGACWRPQEILILPDGSDAHMRRLRYTGPGAVLVTVAHERIEPARGVIGRRRLAIRELVDRQPPVQGQVIALAPGATLSIG